MRSAVFALTCLLTACSSNQVDPNSDGEVDPAQRQQSAQTIEHFQEIAAASCFCELRGGDEAACWEPFETATAGYETQGFSESSAPLSAKGLIFPELEDKNVYLRHRLIDDNHAFVCTVEQASRVVKVAMEPMREQPADVDRSFEVATQEIQKIRVELNSAD